MGGFARFAGPVWPSGSATVAAYAGAVKLERKHAVVLLAVAAWNVVTYAQFTRALATTQEDRPTSYYVAHAVLIVVNLAIGMMTPPFGITLFTTTRVFNSTIQEVTREVLPFLVAMIAALFLITYVPALVMWIV